MSIGPTIFSLASYERVFQGATIVWREGEDVTDDRLRSGIIMALSRDGQLEIATDRGTTAYVHFNSRQIVRVF
jgi:hypothetical protein